MTMKKGDMIMRCEDKHDRDDDRTGSIVVIMKIMMIMTVMMMRDTEET